MIWNVKREIRRLASLHHAAKRDQRQIEGEREEARGHHFRDRGNGRVSQFEGFCTAIARDDSSCLVGPIIIADGRDEPYGAAGHGTPRAKRLAGQSRLTDMMGNPESDNDENDRRPEFAEV